MNILLPWALPPVQTVVRCTLVPVIMVVVVPGSLTDSKDDEANANDPGPPGVGGIRSDNFPQVP